MACRMIMIFQYGPYTWTEAFWNNLVSNPASDIAKNLSGAIGQIRANLLGAGAQITAIRWDVGSAARDTFYYTNDAATDGTWTRQGAIVGQPGNLGNAIDPDYVLKVRLEGGANNFSMRYMGGMAQSMFNGPNGYLFGGIFGWDSGAWKAWAAAIVDGNWGMMGLQPKAFQTRWPIQSLAQQASGQLQVTTMGGLYTVGGIVQLSGVKMNPPHNLNRSYHVASIVGGNQFITKESVLIPVGATYVPNTGTARTPTPQFHAFTGITRLSVTQRKRGSRGFFSQHGRQKTVA